MSAISTPEAVALQFAGQCDRGKIREENQDAVRQCATPLGDLLIVADGIGGYEGGAVASRMAIEAISASLEGIPTFFPIDIAIEEAVCRANAEIVAAAAEPGTPNNRMGSTVVLALLQRDPESAQAPVKACIGHIGDSRAYLLHSGRLTRITRDHSAIQLLLDHDLIAPEQARNHPDASVLTRTLGHEPNVKVDLNSIELEPGDTLLLCSDGLWGYVSDQEIERVLADPELSAEQASRSLLDLALDAGGHDNIGIQLARVSGTGIAAASREPAPAFEPQSDPEFQLSYLLASKPPEPLAPSAPQPESAPLDISSLGPSEAAPVAESSAPLALGAAHPDSELEFLPASASEALLASPAEPETAPPAGAGIEFEPMFRFESALEAQMPEQQITQGQIAEGQTLENQFPENRFPEDGFSENEVPDPEFADSQFVEWQAAPVSAFSSESALALASPEPRMTTILETVATLWELFVDPLGRDFDFAPEWHTDFAAEYKSLEQEEAEPQAPAIPTLVAAILVTCAASPKREFENFLGLGPDLAARFKSSAPQVSTFLKFLGILLLGFSTSCALVYCALFQDWFGIDYFLHLR
jgi:PPM family protein phosphatase